MKKTVSLVVGMVMAVAMLLSGCGGGPSAGSTESTSQGSAAGDTLKKIKDKGTLIVGSSNDAPFSYIDVATNEFSGTDAAVIKEIMKRMGVNKVEMKTVPFENLIVELNNGSIDMVVDALYIKQERLEKAYFTDVWYQESEAVVTKKDSAFQVQDSLKTAVIGAQKGTAFLETAQKWKEAGQVKDVVIMNSQAELIMAVNTGKIDACVTDGIVAAYTLKKDPTLSLKIMEPYKPDSIGKIGAVIRFADKTLLDEVNKNLNDMRKDGTLKKILVGDYGLPETYLVINENDYKTKNVKWSTDAALLYKPLYLSIACKRRAFLW